MTNDIRYGFALRLYKNEKFFGPGVARLLALVREKGSLRMAAAEMRMAYSKAWKMLKTAEAELGFPLLESQTGGKGGGGAALTEKGADFLERYTAFEQALEKEARKQFLKYFG